jgi:hypothetical protein
MALVFKVSLESGNVYCRKKKDNSFNYIKNFIFSFLSLFHVVMFFHFFPFKFYTNLYIIFLFKLIIFLRYLN